MTITALQDERATGLRPWERPRWMLVPYTYKPTAGLKAQIDALMPSLDDLEQTATEPPAEWLADKTWCGGANK